MKLSKKNSQETEAARDENAPADFETAIKACGFGYFNIAILLTTIPGIASNIFETSAISYVLPAAECDLDLSLLDKGSLNAITYAGMITSACLWGYLADTKGRKVVLVSGLLLTGICVLSSIFSQTKTQLMIFKFFGGFFAGGPFAVNMTYLSELHGQKHRAKIMLVLGMMKSLALLALPILAFVILPLDINLNLFGLTFHSWQIFIFVTAVPSLISGCAVFFFPESPKFLMSQGRNDEALKAFQTIYKMNKRKDKNTYPIKFLEIENAEKAARHTEALENPHQRQSRKIQFKEGFQQLKPLFTSPYLRLSLMAYFLNFFIMTGQNSVRLWLPQIFASMEEYEHLNMGTPSMCAILSYNVNKTQLFKSPDPATECQVHIVPESYSNNIIVAASGFVGYLVALIFVNKIGNKNILASALIISCFFGFSMYWSGSTLSTLIIASGFVAASNVAGQTVISSSVSIFPTIMRTMVISIIMSFGRSGSSIGNVVLPFLMALGCIPPFIMIGFVYIAAFTITMFLPIGKNTALK